MKNKETNILKLINMLSLKETIKLFTSKNMLYKLGDTISTYYIVISAMKSVVHPDRFLDYLTICETLGILKIMTKNSRKNNDYIIKNLMNNNKEIIEKIQTQLINSETYKECISEYNDYLLNLVELYRDIKLTEPIDSAIGFEILLHKGFFHINIDINIQYTNILTNLK